MICRGRNFFSKKKSLPLRFAVPEIFCSPTERLSKFRPRHELALPLSATGGGRARSRFAVPEIFCSPTERLSKFRPRHELALPFSATGGGRARSLFQKDFILGKIKWKYRFPTCISIAFPFFICLYLYFIFRVCIFISCAGPGLRTLTRSQIFWCQPRSDLGRRPRQRDADHPIRSEAIYQYCESEDRSKQKPL